jgi:hypothetical protein
MRRLRRRVSVQVRAQGTPLDLQRAAVVSAIDTVLLALGRGDRALAWRMAGTALLTAGPAMLLVAIVLALGPGR